MATFTYTGSSSFAKGTVKMYSSGKGADVVPVKIKKKVDQFKFLIELEDGTEKEVMYYSMY